MKRKKTLSLPANKTKERTVSGLQACVKQVLVSYARRERSRNPKTHVLRLKKQSTLRRYGDGAKLPLARMFVRTAVEHFAAGNHREARYFYNGAFEFGNKDAIRGHLLGCALATAKKAFAAGDHAEVLRLLAAVHFYPPQQMCVDDIHELFDRHGIPVGQLQLVSDDETIRRLRCVGVKLPVLAAA